jgi:protein gp37
LFLTKRPKRAAAILAAASPDEQRLWKPKSLIGFSAEGQPEFDQRRAAMKPLAEAGWPVCASLAPLREPITLPPDYLSLAIWTIVYGEQGRHEDCRDCDPDWVRAVVKQCHGATQRIPVFVRQMARRETIPLDLLLHEFPSLPISRSQAPARLTRCRPRRPPLIGSST